MPRTNTPPLNRQWLDNVIEKAVETALNDHLDSLGEHEPSNVYRAVVDKAERPMLEIMMRNAHGNQSLVAQRMGINRATLRTKLKRHGLL